MYVNILVHHDKCGDRYWLVDTPERLEAAQRRLFTYLDQCGCYDSSKPHAPEARAGDIKAIQWVLDVHRDYEYEGWHIEQASIPE